MKNTALCVAVACLLALPLSAQPAPYLNSVSVTVIVLGAEPALFTDGLERVVPVWAAIISGQHTDYARVYCVGQRVSWKCRNLEPMAVANLAGHLDFGLHLTDGVSPFFTVSPAIVVDAVQLHTGSN